TGAMAGVTVHGISQEAIDDFWRHNDQMSLRSNQKGLNYALEGYIILLLRRSMKSLNYRPKFTGHSVRL
ncbi:hypothetical protein P7L93_24700, partial [Vibrio parahaemolyticus]|nr:hypothetical protein [Vibrio parahaemolyticus]